MANVYHKMHDYFINQPNYSAGTVSKMSRSLGQSLPSWLVSMYSASKEAGSSSYPLNSDSIHHVSKSAICVLEEGFDAT